MLIKLPNNTKILKGLSEIREQAVKANEKNKLTNDTVQRFLFEM